MFPFQILKEEIHSATTWIRESGEKLADFLIVINGKAVNCMWPQLASKDSIHGAVICQFRYL